MSRHRKSTRSDLRQQTRGRRGVHPGTSPDPLWDQGIESLEPRVLLSSDALGDLALPLLPAQSAVRMTPSLAGNDILEERLSAFIANQPPSADRLTALPHDPLWLDGPMTMSVNAVELPAAAEPSLDLGIRTQLIAAFAAVEAVGGGVTAIAGTPFLGDTTAVPFTDYTVTSLLYPNLGDLDGNGAAVPAWNLSIQPQGIGTFVELQDAVTTYLTVNGAGSTWAGLRAAIEAELTANLPGVSPVIDVQTEWDGDTEQMALTVRIATTMGYAEPLNLGDAAEDLKLRLTDPPDVAVGGGGDIEFTITLDLLGRAAPALATNKVTLDFTRFNALAGFAFADVTTDVEIGVIAGQIVNGSGTSGATFPVTLTGGNSKTLNNWLLDGSEVTGFGARTGAASFELPLDASLGGVSATTVNSKLTVTDSDLFDENPPSYAGVDYASLAYFGSLDIESVIQEILAVRSVYESLQESGDDLFGLPIPFADDVEMGTLFDFVSLFDREIGDEVDVVEAIMNTIGRDDLTDYRLPFSDDAEPIAAMWSDLRAGFDFGVVVNAAWPITAISVPADLTRTSLNDLRDDLNTAFTNAGLDIEARNIGDKLSFKATNVNVREFVFVPEDAPAGVLAAAVPPGDLTVLPEDVAYYYEVTGTTAGAVTGTNYYTLDSPIAAAAVHAGILEDGETGIVKITPVGELPVIWGSSRNGVNSGGDTTVDVYLIESTDVSLKRLGIMAPDQPVAALDVVAGGRLRASLPIQADLSSAAEFTLVIDAVDFPITVADNGRADRLDTLADVNTALVNAGIAADDLTARLIDAAGNEVTTLDGGTDYFLELYLPDASSVAGFVMEPNSDHLASRILPLGFLTGDVSSQPRPEGLSTFEDLQSAAFFPDITITPVFDAGNNTVTLTFKASEVLAPQALPLGFDFDLSPLGSIRPDDADLTFNVSPTASLNFAIEFQIGPAAPVYVSAQTDAVANGQLSGDANFTLDLVLQDYFSVTVEQAWTAANTGIQDLVGDVNRALKDVTPSAGGSVDLTADRIIARNQTSSDRIEFVTATPINAGVGITFVHTDGVLAGDATFAFSHDGSDYILVVSSDSTQDNASFDDLVLDVTDALSSVVQDANGNSTIDPGETQASIAAEVFATTIADAAGARTNEVVLFSSGPASAAWPNAVSVSAAAGDPTIDELGFDDGADADVSRVTGEASGAVAYLRDHTDASALASGNMDVAIPSFAGEADYGFNAIAFASTSGGVIDMELRANVDPAADASPAIVAGDLSTYLTRTLTDADMAGDSNAALTLENLTVTGGTIDPAATIQIDIDQLDANTVVAEQVIGLPIPVPEADGSGVLSGDATINFLFGGVLYSLTVTQAAAAGNGDFDDLAGQFNDALTNATRTNRGVATAGYDASGLFTVSAVDGQIQINQLKTIENVDYADVSLLPDLGAFGEVGAQGAFGFDTVIDALTDAFLAMDAIQSELPQFTEFELPLINASISDFIDIKGDMLSRIDDLRDTAVSSPAAIAPALAAGLSVPDSHVQVNFDNALNAYRIDVQYETGLLTSKTLDLTLEDYYRLTDETLPDGLERLTDAGGVSPLAVAIQAVSVLSIGVDLSDPDNPRTFLYAHDGSDDLRLSDSSANGTSFEVLTQIIGDGIDFTASIGAFGVFVRDGNVSLSGEASTSGGNVVYTFDATTNELHPVTPDDAASLAVTLGDPGEVFYIDAQGVELDALDVEEYAATFAGTLDVNLPLFTPTEFVNPFTNRTVNAFVQGTGLTDVNPGGNLIDIKVTDFDGFYAATIEYQGAEAAIAVIYDTAAADGNRPLTGPEQTQVDALEMQIADLSGSGVVDIFSPDVEGANSGLGEPTLLDLFRDPAILVDGLDVILGTIESGLQGLDNLNIPVIGDTLGSAADDVFSFRSGWLTDMRDRMRGQGEAALEAGKDAIFNYLGPDGLDLLLEDNGISSVDGMIPADDPDDITLDFLDEEGNKLTGLGGFGANAVEFRMRIGSVLVDTGVDISFDFDALEPVLSLELDGGLAFKLGWDMTIGFGIDLEDGFYIVVDDGNGANELELRFETLLLGEQEDFTVEERVGSPTGFSIKDDDGNWVLGPRMGDGSQEILNVMAVIADGTDAPVELQDPALIDACCNVTPGGPVAVEQVAYWVVAAEDGGMWYPAYLGPLGYYRPQNGADWTAVNGAADRNPDEMIQYNQTSPFTATGQFTIFQLTATDTISRGLTPHGDADYFYDPATASTVTSFGRNDADAGVNRNNHLPTRIAGRIGVNLADPETDDGTDGRITFNEMRSAGADLIELDLSAEAVVNLGMTLFVSEDANIPRITATFNLDWRTDSMTPPSNPFAQDEQQKRDLVPEVGLNDIRLDMGTFLTKLIKPIAEQIDDVFKPIDPLIDVITASIPVISDIAGRPIRLTDLLTTFGGPKGQAVATVIDMIVLVRELSAVMGGVPDDANIYLPIGNFWLAKVSAGPFGRPGLGTQIYYDNNEVQAPSITQRNQSLIAQPGQASGGVTGALSKLDDLDQENSSQPGITNNNQRGGFGIPLLQDPITVFKLLMGEDVPLVTFSLPTLDFTFNQRIPLLRIVVFEVGLRFEFQIKGQLHIGYDTYGIRLFSDSRDPEDLLHGFYVSDRLNADGTGPDVDEFSLSATLALYGGIDLYLARGGIEGGFTFNASINFNDPNNDGKLRLTEMIDLVAYTGNPLDLADLSFSGEVYARYYYWAGLKIWTPWKTYVITLVSGGNTFARATVFSFTREGNDGPPTLASMADTIDLDGQTFDDTLILHMGPSASKRVSNQDPLNSVDGAERFVVWNDAPGSGTVHVKYLNFSGTYTETHTGVSRVVALGGNGDDSIDASGLHGLPVKIEGGTGDDTILVGSVVDGSLSILNGDSGDDVITITGAGAVRIDGDDGSDDINAGTGSAEIFPGAGSDTVNAGGAGSSNIIRFARAFGLDTINLDALAAVNRLDFYGSSSGVVAHLAGVGSTISAGDTNRALFDLAAATEIRGSAGRDTFNIIDPDTRDANAGRGLVIRGGIGNDTYNVTANDVSNMAGDGITIDDGIYPDSVATVGVIDVLDDCGLIQSIDIDDAGENYAIAPDVIISDPTGSGARAVAGIDDDGRVTGIFIIDGGADYTAPTVTLVNRKSTGDTLNVTSTSESDVTLDRRGNGDVDYQLSTEGKDIKWIGWDQPRTLRPNGYGISELDSVNITLPDAKLTVFTEVDVTDRFSVEGMQLVQREAFTAGDVRIITERGFQAVYPINAVNNGDVTIRSTGADLIDYANSNAQANAVVAGNVLTSVDMVNYGRYYDFPPIVSVTDANGRDARATAQIDVHGELIGIVVTAGGENYFTSPAPDIDIAPPSSIQLNHFVTSSTVGSLPGAGDGRGTVTLRADLGSIDMAGYIDFPQASFVEWHDGDFAYPQAKTLADITPAAYANTVGGQGAAATAVIDDQGRLVDITVDDGGSGYDVNYPPTVDIEGAGEATAIIQAGAITGYRITNRGGGYANPPAIRIVSSGFGKLVGDNPALSLYNRNHIRAAGGSLVAVAYDGIGGPDQPLRTDVRNFVGQTFELNASIHVLEKDALDIGLVDNVNGLQTVDGDVTITTFFGTMGLGTPVQETTASGALVWEDADKTIPVWSRDENGNIIFEGGRINVGQGHIQLTADDIDVNNFLIGSGGTLELQPVKFDAPIGLTGTRATVNAAMSAGMFTGLTDLWSGRDYTSTPLVTVPPPGQTAVGASRILAGQVTGINVIYGGSNYNAGFQPIVTLVGGAEDGSTPVDAATATATFDADGEVTGFTITAPGSGYYYPPQVVIASPGQQAIITANVADGLVTGFNLVNAGSNYQFIPAVTIDAPYEFDLDGDEISFFADGFDQVIIGRADGAHKFYAPLADFIDEVQLRSPRIGGSIVVESLSAGDEGIVIVGSGSTLHLDNGTPSITGSFIEIDDNIIVHDDVNATLTASDAHAHIFGVGKGKIDGVAGSTTENFLIDAQASILVTGAIGQTFPLNDLTLQSQTGSTINLQQNVTIDGDLHIIEGGDITIGGNVTIGGDLIIDAGAEVVFQGDVIVAGNVLITDAAGVSFEDTITVTGNFNVDDADSLAFAGDVSVMGDLTFGDRVGNTPVGRVTFGSGSHLDVDDAINIFTTGEQLFGNAVGGDIQPDSITLRSVSGDITFDGVVNVGSGIVQIDAARDVAFDDDLTAGSLLILDASDQVYLRGQATVGSLSVTATNLFRSEGQLEITAGNATIIANEVDFGGGTSSVQYAGSPAANGVLTIQPRTATRNITLGSPPGAFTSMDLSDVDLSAISLGFNHVVIGDAAAATGQTTLGTIGSQQGAGNSRILNRTTIYGGGINVLQPIDVVNTADVVSFIARTGDIVVNAAINATALERNAEVRFETLAASGDVLLNAAVFATTLIAIDSAATVVADGSGVGDGAGRLDAASARIHAGGVIELPNSNDIDALALAAPGFDATFREDTGFNIETVDGCVGVNVGSGVLSLTSAGGSVTQTQPITAAELVMLGAGGSFVIDHAGNAIGAMAGDTGSVEYRDAGVLTIGEVAGVVGFTVAGDLTLIAAGNLNIDVPLTTLPTGHVHLESETGRVTLAAAADINAGGNVTLASATDIRTAGDITTAGGDVSLGSPVVLTGNVNIEAPGGDASFDSTIDGPFDLSINVEAGAVDVAGKVGGMTPLTSLIINQAMTVGLADDVTTTGVQQYVADVVNAAGPLTTAGSDLSITGQLAMLDDITLTTGGDIVVGSVAAGSRDLTVVSGEGSTTIQGAVTDAGRLILQANDPSSTGDVTFEGNVDADAIDTFPQPYNVSFTGSDVDVQDSVVFTQRGSLTLGDDAADVLRFANGLTFTGTIEEPATTRFGGMVRTDSREVSLRDVELQAHSGIDTTDAGASEGADINILGRITSDYNLALVTGVGDANVNDEDSDGQDEVINLSGENIRFDRDINALSVTIDGNITLEADITIRVTEDVIIRGQVTGPYQLTIITTTGVIHLNADVDIAGGLSLDGPAIELGGDINAADLTVDGPVTLVDDTTIITTGDVHFTGPVTGGFDLSIDAGIDGGAGTGTVAMDDLVSIGGAFDVTAGTLELAGSVTAASIDIDADVDLTGDITMNAAGPITFAGDVVGDGDLNITAIGQTVTFGGNVTLAGGLDVEAGSTLFSGDVNANGINLVGLVEVALGGVLNAGAAGLTIVGALESAGEVDLRALGGAIDIAGTINVGTLNVNAATFAFAGDIIADELDIDAAPSFIGDVTLTIAGHANFQHTVDATGDFNLTTTGSATFGDDVNITGAGTFDIGTFAAFAGDLIVGNELTFTAAGNVTIAGELQSGDLSLTAASVDIVGATTVTGDAAITATADVALGAITATGDLIVNAVNVLGRGAGDVQGEINITATDTLTWQAPLAAGGNATLAGATIALADLTAGMAVNIIAGELNVTGTITAGDDESELPGDIDITADQATITGAITATGDLVILVTHALTITGVITVGGNGSITAESMNLNGMSTFAGDVSFTATAAEALPDDLPTITLGGPIHAGMTLTITAAGLVETDALQAGGTLTVNTDDLNVAGDVTTGDDVIIDVTHAANFAGAVNVTGLLMVTASQAAWLSTVDVQGAATVNGAEGIEIAAAFNAGSVQLTGDVTLTEDASLQGETTVHVIGAITAAGDLIIMTGDGEDTGDVTLQGVAIAAGHVDIQAGSLHLFNDLTGGSLNLAAPIILHDDLTIAGGALTVGSTVDSTADGEHTLTINTGAAAATFAGPVGGTTPLAALGITAAGDVTLHDVTAGELTQLAGAGATQLAGDVTLSVVAGLTLNTSVVRIDATVAVAAGPATITGSASITIGAAGVLTAAGDILLSAATIIIEPVGLIDAGDAGDITLHTDRLVLPVTGDIALVGAGTLHLAPITNDYPIQIAGDERDDAMTWSADEQAAVSPAFTQITVGSVNGDHHITISEISLPWSLHAYAGGAGGSATITGDITAIAAAAELVVMVGGDVHVHADIHTIAGDVSLTSTLGQTNIGESSSVDIVTERGDVSITSPQIMFASAAAASSIEAGGAITLLAETLLHVRHANSRLDADGAIVIEASAGDVIIAGAATARVTIDVDAANDITLTAWRARAYGDASVRAQRNVTATDSVIIAETAEVTILADSNEDGDGQLMLFNTQQVEGADLPDLMPTIESLDVSSPIALGQSGSAVIRLDNVGLLAVKGGATVRLYLSADQSFDSLDRLVGEATRSSLQIKPGKSDSLRVDFAVPTDLPVGEYFIVAHVVADTVVGETMTINNTASSAEAFVIQAPDLAVSAIAFDGARALLLGETANATIDLTNLGPVAADGRADVVVFASLTGSLDDAIEVGRLSSQAIRLNTDATKTFKVDVTMPDVAGQYTLLAAVQPESSIPDADLSNNLLIGDEVSVRDAFVDLAASIESSQLEDDQDAGDRGKAIVSLGNVGNINARGKAVIQLFAVSDELGVEPVLIGEQSVNIKLNAGADKSFKVRYELPASLRGGDYELAAVATATDGNVDENAGNDEATAAASFSVHNGDLTPTEITASFGGAQLTGASGQVQVRVANSGDVNIDAATDVVIYATTTGSLAGAVEVGRATQQRLNVAGGKDTQVRVDVQLPAAAGDYQWLAVVDAGSDIAETNETNNALLGGDVSVGEPFIDLSAAVAKLKVKKSQPGGKGIIKVSVANLGNTAAEGRITLQAFASIGEVVGVDALQLGELADKKIKLKPGQVKTLKIRLQLPSDIAAGDYHVLAVVERDDRIAVLEDPTQYGFNNTALADDTFSIAA